MKLLKWAFLLSLCLCLAACGTVIHLRIQVPEQGAETEASPTQAGLLAITTVNANLRRGASTSFAIVRVIPSGSSVRLVARTANNAWVQTNEGFWLSVSVLEIRGDINSLETEPIPTREGV